MCKIIIHLISHLLKIYWISFLNYRNLLFILLFVLILSKRVEFVVFDRLYNLFIAVVDQSVFTSVHWFFESRFICSVCKSFLSLFFQLVFLLCLLLKVLSYLITNWSLKRSFVLDSFSFLTRCCFEMEDIVCLGSF